jgi:hypothetical protein
MFQKISLWLGVKKLKDERLRIFLCCYAHGKISVKA